MSDPRRPGSAVNELGILIATVNGSGSQSANKVLLRAIFRMGVPVSGKNIFPSNISGLPTWFAIRASEAGRLGRKREVELLVAMNPQTAREDLEGLRAGALCVYDEPLGLRELRRDLEFFPVPFDALAGGLTEEPRLRRLLKNMVYVGVLAELLGLEEAEIGAALELTFKAKAKALALNRAAVEAGAAYARASLPRQEGFRIERRDLNRGKILVDGNSAAALGAVFGGLGVLAWYPITPSSSLCEAVSRYQRRLRADGKGGATLAVVQAEDELAAAGMVIGAGWAGARSMTATSGPGISLMAEFVGLAYFAEIPAVFWDVERAGPSTGMPTRTAQGDLGFLASLSHGDTGHPVLIPGSPAECFEFAGRALDLAEELQAPVFVLSDLDLGMNDWISEPFAYPEEPLRRGKVLSAESLAELGGSWGRYRDPDGDGVPWRTLPGTPHPAAAYFTRGSGHDAEARYSERPSDYQALLDRLARKLEAARDRLPRPVLDLRGSRLGIIAYGSTDQAMGEAREILRAAGLETDYFRLRALPLGEELGSFLAGHERVYVVEQNRDGQLAELIRKELGEGRGRLRSILSYTGLPVEAASVAEALLRMEASLGGAEPLLRVGVDLGPGYVPTGPRKAADSVNAREE